MKDKKNNKENKKDYKKQVENEKKPFTREVNMESTVDLLEVIYDYLLSSHISI